MSQFTVTDVRFYKIKLEKLRPHKTKKLNTRIEAQRLKRTPL